MTRTPRLPFARRAAVLATALALAGCASFAADGEFGPVERMTAERIGQSPRLVRTPEDARAE